MCEHTCYTHTHTTHTHKLTRIKPLILWCVFNVLVQRNMTWNHLRFLSTVKWRWTMFFAAFSLCAFVTEALVRTQKRSVESLTSIVSLRISSVLFVFSMVHLVHIVFIRKLNETSAKCRTVDAYATHTHTQCVLHIHGQRDRQAVQVLRTCFSRILREYARRLRLCFVI